jgi:Ran GTPase-activating protein (RanGAP) involved in mRNA processing and transport
MQSTVVALPGLQDRDQFSWCIPGSGGTGLACFVLLLGLCFSRAHACAGAAELAHVLPCMVELEVLRLESCALSTRGVKEFSLGIVSAAEAVAHPASHRSFRMIELNLQSNQAGSNAAEALAEALAHLPELQKLLYAGNRPAYEGLASLAGALVQCPALQVRVDATLRLVFRV